MLSILNLDPSLLEKETHVRNKIRMVQLDNAGNDLSAIHGTSGSGSDLAKHDDPPTRYERNRRMLLRRKRFGNALVLYSDTQKEFHWQFRMIGYIPIGGKVFSVRSEG